MNDRIIKISSTIFSLAALVLVVVTVRNVSVSLTSSLAAVGQPSPSDVQMAITMHRIPVGQPAFCSTATITSKQGGAWSSPATWDAGRVPGANDRVVIDHDVQYDSASDAKLDCIKINQAGALKFAPTINTKLAVTTLLDLGTLEIGTVSAPIAGNVKAEIVINDVPIDTAQDPEQLGHGILGLGVVTMHGSVKTPTFLHLAANAKKGASTISLESAVSGWRAGDMIVLPGTHAQNQYETNVIQAVNGATVTLATPLIYDHDGVLDADGLLAFMPHAANFERNVLIRSENPNGIRGHTQYFHRVNVDIRYVEFKDLGRTTVENLDSTTLDSSGVPTHIGKNQIGRYPLHLHHVWGPTTPQSNGYQATVIGASVVNALKWGVTIHNTHYSLFTDNVVYNADGAAYALEDGGESYDVLDHNFAVRNDGRFVANEDDTTGVIGVGFWTAAANSYLRNNVSANGKYGGFYGTFNFGGATYPARQSEGETIRKSFTGFIEPIGMTGTLPNAVPILEYKNNEAYATHFAHGLWRIPAYTRNQISNVKAWNVDSGFVMLYGSYIKLKDIDFVNDEAVLKDPKTYTNIENLGMTGSEGLHTHIVYDMSVDVEGGRIHNFYRGISGSNQQSIISNLDLVNFLNIVQDTGSLPMSNDVTFRNISLRSLKFTTPRGPTVHIDMGLCTWPSNICANGTLGTLLIPQYYRFFNTTFDGVPMPDFQAYYREQAPTYVLPQYGTFIHNFGTNANAFAKYNLAVAGAVAPCTTTNPKVRTGFICSPPIASIPPRAEHVPQNMTGDSVGFGFTVPDVILKYLVNSGGIWETNASLNQAVPVTYVPYAPVNLTYPTALLSEQTPVNLKLGYNLVKRDIRASDGTVFPYSFLYICTANCPAAENPNTVNVIGANTPFVSSTPTPTQTNVITSTPTSVLTPTKTPTSIPSSTPTASAAPTATHTPTTTSTIAPTPPPGSVRISGRVYNQATNEGFSGVIIETCRGIKVTTDSRGEYGFAVPIKEGFCARATPEARMGFTGPILNNNATYSWAKTYEYQIAGWYCSSQGQCGTHDVAWDRSSDSGFDFKYQPSTQAPTSTVAPTVTPNSFNRPSPSSYGLKEGDLISSRHFDADPDIFIVNDWGFKRLFLNELIFSFYGHLSFSNVRAVEPSTRVAFETSGLFTRCTSPDKRVFAVEITGNDEGILHYLNISGDDAVKEDPEFFNKVFCINDLEYNWYTKNGTFFGTPYTSTTQIIKYAD